jgi:hypothetical protein
VPRRSGLRAPYAFWVVVLVFGLVGIGAGVVFWTLGPEMTFMTLLFGGPGVYLTLHALPHVLGWEE